MRANPTTRFVRPMLVHLEKFAVVHHPVNHVLDVVRLVGFGGHDGVQRRVHAVDGVGGGAPRRVFAIVLRQVADAARESCCRHSASSAAMKCPTPLTALCVMGPPSFSLVTSSWVTVLITSGPVTNM